MGTGEARREALAARGLSTSLQLTTNSCCLPAGGDVCRRGNAGSARTKIMSQRRDLGKTEPDKQAGARDICGTGLTVKLGAQAQASRGATETPQEPPASRPGETRRAGPHHSPSPRARAHLLLSGSSAATGHAGGSSLMPGGHLDSD